MTAAQVACYESICDRTRALENASADTARQVRDLHLSALAFHRLVRDTMGGQDAAGEGS